MDFFYNLKKLLFIIDKKFIDLIPYIILFLISAIVDVVGLGLIAPIINLIVNPESELTFLLNIIFYYAFSALHSKKYNFIRISSSYNEFRLQTICFFTISHDVNLPKYGLLGLCKKKKC